MMDLNHPEIVAEVTALFAKYETALVSNDVATLDALFFDSPATIRFGIGENLFGHDEISAFRAARPSVGLARTVIRTKITTFGRDTAVTAILFKRETSPGKVGRQMQTWVRLSGIGWRIVAAHVSVIDEPQP